MRLLTFIPISALILLLWLPCKGGQINWAGAFNRVNLKSNGTPMDTQMVFELGVFTPGFAPTEANKTLWAANWWRASLAFYNADLRYFAGVHPVSSNAFPFSAGSKGYIWGHDGTCSNGEWILMSDPNWSWPTQNPTELAVNWTVSSASQVILGQANGAGFQMKSAQASGPLPATSWAEWRLRMFTGAQLADLLVSGPQADPDADGIVNLAEFALGGHALIGGSFPGRVVLGFMIVDGRQRLTLTLTKRCDRTVNWGAQASVDLVNWPANSVTSLTETAEILKVMEMVSQPSSVHIFMRPVFQLP